MMTSKHFAKNDAKDTYKHQKISKLTLNSRISLFRSIAQKFLSSMQDHVFVCIQSFSNQFHSDQFPSCEIALC